MTWGQPDGKSDTKCEHCHGSCMEGDYACSWCGGSGYEN
jgi:hypothetical protein